MKKRTIVLLCGCIILIIGISAYSLQEKKEIEDQYSKAYVNESQYMHGQTGKNAEEAVKVGYNKSAEIVAQGNADTADDFEGPDEAVVDAAVEQAIHTDQEPEADESIIGTEDDGELKEPIAEEPALEDQATEDPTAEESITEKSTEEEPVAEEEETVVLESIPLENVETSPASKQFSEIFINQEIDVVENPDTVEEFEAILLHMCETNTLTYSLEYSGISFDDLLTDETQKEIAEAFDSIFHKYPEYMSFTNRMTYRAKGDSNKVMLTLMLSSDTGMDAETLISSREAFFIESQEIIGMLRNSGLLYEGQSDRDKALVLFDWVVQNTEYDNDFHAESYTGYGVYENGLGVCQGYTAAYNALCKIAGLRVEGIGGLADGVDHIWTKALFAGEDIYIDATWGDSYVNSDASNYDYFLVDGDTLAASHTWQ